MKASDVEKELIHLQKVRHRSWPKLVSRLKKQLDYRMDCLIKAKGVDDFKLGFMPFLMNIDLEGVTNTELAKKFAVTKQATSKILNELAELKYVTMQPHGEDGRSSIIHLTDKGKRIVVDCKKNMEHAMDEYRTLLGRKELDTLIDMVSKIADYNDAQSKTPYI